MGGRFNLHVCGTCLHGLLVCALLGRQRGWHAHRLELSTTRTHPLRRYAPPDVAGSDAITAPRSWHFSNRSDQLDEEQQERVAAQNPDVS